LRPLTERRRQIEKDRIDAYKKHHNIIGEKLLRAAMRSIATVSAADNVNRIIENRLGMVGTRLDQKDMLAAIDLVLRAEIGNILAEQSFLPKEAAAELTRRIIAQLMPTKDDVMIPGSIHVPERRRTEALEDAIKREMRRVTQQRKEK
jgi:hypothetical protein